jgi:hypothetical protein
MRLKSLVLFGAICSCKSTVPAHEVCIISAEEVGGWCARTDVDSEQVEFKDLQSMDGFIARSPEDEQKIIEWARRNCKKD